MEACWDLRDPKYGRFFTFQVVRGVCSKFRTLFGSPMTHKQRSFELFSGILWAYEKKKGKISTLRNH